LNAAEDAFMVMAVVEMVVVEMVLMAGIPT
jgi:hypothetical protein